MTKQEEKKMKKSFFNFLLLILISLIICIGNNYAKVKNESDIEMVVQKGHSSGASRIQFTPDNKYIISCGSDSTIKIWNLKGRLVKTLTAHTATVYSIAINPKGKYFASASADKTIKLWTLDGKLIRTFKGSKGAIVDIDFSPDGKFIISTDHSERLLLLWNLNGKLIKKISANNSQLRRVKISPDGKYIASSCGEDIIFWSFKGELLKKFKGHNDQIRSINFSSDGKHLISCSRSAIIKIWNIENKNVMTLTTYDNEWIMYTPDGYFDSSRYGGRLVGMTVGLSSYAVDQFAAKYNRPDIILNRVGLGTPEQINHFYNQYKKRLKRMGLKEEQFSEDYHVPEVEILETKQDGKFLKAVFKLSDKKYDLKKCNVYINDVPRYKGYGKDISGKFKKFKVKLELTSGKNKIEITCINEKGAESYRALTYAEYNEKVKGDLYYIGFGVSKYKDKSFDLKYADKDAEDLAGLFSQMKDKFKNIHAKTYLNEEVTIENIKKSRELLKNAKVDDTFVLFIAGHGIHDRDEEAAYYYLTHNADINNLSQTAANFDLLENLMHDIKPRNKLFLIDTCESGEIEDDTQKQFIAMANTRGINARAARALTITSRNKGSKKKRTYLYDRDRYIYNDLLRRSGAIVFSSSCGGEFSYEKDEYQNGLFTEAIIKCLSGQEADEDQNGEISTDELRKYIIKDVSIISGGLQHPAVDRDNIYQKFGFQVVE